MDDRSPGQTPPDAESVEQRLRRLEFAVAAMQDSTLVEKRVFDRVITTIENDPSVGRAAQAQAGQSGVYALDPRAPRALGPAAHAPIPPDQVYIADEPPPPQSPYSPLVGVMMDQARANPNFAQAVAAAGQAKWLLTDVAGDVKAILGMYFDSRYRMTNTTRFAVYGLLGAIAFFSLITISPFGIVEKPIALLLSMLLFKVLHRESLRYRQTMGQYEGAPYPPPR